MPDEIVEQVEVQQPEAQVETPQEQAAETPVEKPKRERDAHGRFVPKGGAFDKAAVAFIQKSADAFDDLHNEMTGEEPEPEQEETPAADDEKIPPAEKPAPQKAEGPSHALKTVAKSLGLPADLIDSATSDEHLGNLLKYADRFQPRQQQREEQPPPTPKEEEPAEEPQPLARMLLSDEDYPADDPVRAQMQHLIDAVNEMYGRFDADIEQVYHHANEQIAARANHQKQELQMEFDKAADALDDPVLGASSAIEELASTIGPEAAQNHPLFLVRKAVWQEYKKLKVNFPKVPSDQLLAFAYTAAFGKPPAAPKPNPANQARIDALQRQANGRLGGGPAGPSAREAPKPKGSAFDAAVARHLNGAR